jgi:hypothetical protein
LKAENVLYLNEKRSQKLNQQMQRYLRSKLKIKNKYIERIYSVTSDSINAILDSLDSPGFPLSNEYKFIFLAFIREKLFTILPQQFYIDFLKK